MNDILAAAKGSGLDTISTEKLVRKMVSIGYSVNAESLGELLNNNPFVETADETQITLSGSSVGMDGGDEVGADVDSSPDQVSAMAQSAVDKGN